MFYQKNKKSKQKTVRVICKNEQCVYVASMENEELTAYEQAAQKALDAIAKKVVEMKASGTSQAEISCHHGYQCFYNNYQVAFSLHT